MEEHSGKVKVRHLTKGAVFGVFNPLQTSEFDYLLLESIDETLADLLGRRSRDKIYDHLATELRCGREEIPGKIYEFYGFLENIFSSGSRTVGRTIIRRLCNKLGYEFVHVPHFEFFDYLDHLRARSERDAANRGIASKATSFRP